MKTVRRLLSLVNVSTRGKIMIIECVYCGDIEETDCCKEQTDSRTKLVWVFLVLCILGILAEAVTWF